MQDVILVELRLGQRGHDNIAERIRLLVVVLDGLFVVVGLGFCKVCRGLALPET